MKQLFLKAFVLQSFWTRALSTAALIVLGGAMAIAQDAGQNPSQDPNQPAASGQRTDGQIEMDVVHSLDASDALKNDLITAATIQSEVTLSGTVSTQASKDLAESIASHVQGVTKVHNNLKIGNPQDAQDEQAAADQSQQVAQQPDDSMAPVPPPVDNGQGAPYPSQNPNQYPNNNQGQYPSPGQYPNQYPQSGQPYPGQQQGQYPSYPPQPGQYPPARPAYGYNCAPASRLITSAPRTARPSSSPSFAMWPSMASWPFQRARRFTVWLRRARRPATWAAAPNSP
jgi:hypothetical protein